MVFTASMFEPDTADKADARGLPGYHPDPAVTDIRGRSPYELGVTAALNPQAAALQATRLAPGEAAQVTELAVPALVKAGTSGTPGELAPLRHAVRPGQGRHPVSGQYTTHEGLAAGHPTSAQDNPPRQRLEQGPASRDARMQVGGPTDLANRDSAHSTIQHSLARELARTSVETVSLRGSSATGMDVLDTAGPGAYGTPVGQQAPGPRRAVTPNAGAAASPVPLLGQSARGWSPSPADVSPSGPLAAAIAAHSACPPAFGLQPHQATRYAPGE